MNLVQGNQTRETSRTVASEFLLLLAGEKQSRDEMERGGQRQSDKCIMVDGSSSSTRANNTVRRA